MRKWEKLVGNKYNSLTLVGVTKRGTRYPGLFNCDCGETTTAEIYKVTNGIVMSCGCMRDENQAKKMIKHGHTSSRGYMSTEYNSWRAMRERCNSPKNKAWHNYGGRGITVCDEWVDFEVFLRDMGEKPSKFHSVDRIDNDGNYEPSNCRWADAKTQANNKRNNKI